MIFYLSQFPSLSFPFLLRETETESIVGILTG